MDSGVEMPHIPRREKDVMVKNTSIVTSLKTKIFYRVVFSGKGWS
jgi:hypothetical protein